MSTDKIINNIKKISESEYHQIANKLIEDLAFAIEDNDSAGDFDIDQSEGIVDISDADSRHWIINKQAPRYEIWLASHISGAHHFVLCDDDKWRNSRGEELFAILCAENLPLFVK